MGGTRMMNSIAVAGCLASLAAAQDEAAACYGPGSVVGAVLGTCLVTLGLFLSCFFLYKMYWKNRKGKHLVLMTDAESPHDQYAFDNPCFREATPIKRSIEDEKESSKLEKVKWPGWPPVHAFRKEKKSEKITSMDDSYVNDSRLKVVTLKSHDFTGLGFNICGNMRDGIFVKDVLHRGPAFESGCINTGDRIDSVCISFRNMVFEDALTILSYASPYDVQVQVENDSCSRPSTLMRSKRESNAVNSSNRILHPKFSRSQSISYLSEIGKNNNKKMSHQIGSVLEKNRINHSFNKSQDFSDFPTLKVSSPRNDGKTHRGEALKMSSPVEEKKPPKRSDCNREEESQHSKSTDPQNKLQKFGIKVLPISINPKMGVQSVTGAKKPAKSPTIVENDGNSSKEKPAKGREAAGDGQTEGSPSGLEDTDAAKENVKAMLAKGFLNLKEKINQNTLGKRKKGEEESAGEEEAVGEGPGGSKQGQEGDFPVPKLRSSVTCGVKAYQQSHINVPEEVSRAGDVARNNRKSIAEARKSSANLEAQEVEQAIKVEAKSDSEASSDRESMKDETKRPRRSKGKAPAPPRQVGTSKEINEIQKESELTEDQMSIFEPETKIIPLKDEDDTEKSIPPSYDSDSDTEPMAAPKDTLNTKIELNATQVTVHQSSTGDSNDDEVEPSRKAASLGDLSKLDSEQPLAVVLERAVSLDLTEGASQCGKKRKAPLPPFEEFPAAFDDLNYRKEPRLENLNTFQRRLKKSSDFGKLEDAICDGPKSLEADANKVSPLDLTETHNHNIQEFSSWLAECRRPKATEEEARNDEEKPRISSTSLVNINSSDFPEGETEGEDNHEGNVSFRVNCENFPDFEIKSSSEKVWSSFPGRNSSTVVVISQPNSMEPAVLEKNPGSDAAKDATNGEEGRADAAVTSEGEAPPPKLPTSPVPRPSTLSTPLSSSLTYITEIKVSTSERGSEKPQAEAPSPSSVMEKIQKFDSARGWFENSPTKNNFTESSKIPVRTMKSETGQKVLATIQSLANESSPTKTPEVEYAKRVASLFSNPLKNHIDILKNDSAQSEPPRPNVSGLYLKTSPPKPSKDYSPTRKVPPVVPPRKTETSLTSKSTVSLELPSPPRQDQVDRNVVTFSSFVGRNPSDDLDGPSKISFKIKERGEINGREERTKPSPAKILSEGDDSKEGP